MNALVIPLTLTKKDFETNAESARKDVDRLTGTVNETNAALTVMKREARAAGDAVDAGLTSKIQETNKALLTLKSELKTAKADYQVLSTMAPPPAPALPAMPKASAAKAAITVAESAGEGAAGAGISQMGKMELAHVGRSLAGSMMAGMPVDRAVEMESPRLISALGPAVMSAVGGLSGLAAVLGPLAVVVGAAATAFAAYNANEAARKTRGAISEVGQNESNLGTWESTFADDGKTTSKSRARRRRKITQLEQLKGQLPDGETLPDENTESAKDLDQEAKAAAELQASVVKQRKGKMNRLANVFGGGIKDADVADVRDRKDALISRRDDVEQRDVGFARRSFNGDQGVESDKLRVSLQEKLSKIQREQMDGTIKDGARQIELAHEEYNLSMEELARKKAYQKDELDMEERITAIRRDGRNVASGEAEERMKRAKADLDAGPQQGPEFRAHQEAYERSKLEHGEAVRRDQAAHNAIAAEEAITEAKRKGYHVDVEIAKVRLDQAQKALANARPGDDTDALQAAVNAAKLQVTTSERETAEKEKQAELETRIANLRGSSDQVRKTTLAAEREDIERRLAVAKPDEQPAIVAEQARNQQQQDEFAKNEKLRDIADQEGHDRASAGHSFADQINLLNQELQRNADRQKWNADENGGDKHMGAQLEDTAEQLKRALDDVTFAEQQRLTALRNQQIQIQNHGYQATVATKDRDIDAKYNAQEAEEMGPNGKKNPAAVALMETNRTAEKFDAAVDEEMMTPAQRRARDRANRRREQAAARVADRQKRHEEAQAADQSTFDDTFHRPGGNHMPGPQHMDAHGHMPDRRIQGADANPAGGKLSMAGVESILHSHTQILSTIAQNAIFKEMA